MNPSPLALPRQLRGPLLTASFGLLAVVVAFAVFIWLPLRTGCADRCARRCRGQAGLAGLRCDQPCRLRCSFSVAGRRLPTGTRPDEPAPVRLGSVRVRVPELNVPLLRLAQAAVRLDAPRAPRLRAKAPRVDLRPELRRRGVRIENQLTTPTCMAHALTSAMEYSLGGLFRKQPAQARAVGAPVRGTQLSRKHVYSLSLHSVGLCQRERKETGSWVLQAASAVKHQGTFRERHWPFRDWDPASQKWSTCEEAANGGKPTARALKERHFFIESFRYLPPFGLGTIASARSPADIEGILGAGYPVVLSVFLIPESFNAAFRRRGLVAPPASVTETPRGAHYVLVVGYDRKRRQLIFANSWGRGFGVGGYGRLTYSYIERYGVEGLYVEQMAVRKAGSP